MNATLMLQDFEEIRRLEIEKLFQTAASSDESDESHRRFAEQATSIEGLLRTVYQSAAIMARKAESIENTARIWKAMIAFCDYTAESLRRLAEQHPRYASKHLYDFTLDTRNAAARCLELHLRIDEQDFISLVNLYDRFANVLDSDSEDARSAEGEFYTLLCELFEKERLTQPKLDYLTFRRSIVLRCKQRIRKGS